VRSGDCEYTTPTVRSNSKVSGKRGAVVFIVKANARGIVSSEWEFRPGETGS
jgi:hypothetical protein